MFYGSLWPSSLDINEPQTAQPADSTGRVSRRQLLTYAGLIGYASHAPVVAQTSAAPPRTQLIWPVSDGGGSISQQTSDLADALARSDIDIIVRPGEHAIGEILIAKGQRIKLSGSPGASLLFMQNKMGGIRFMNSDSSSIENITLKWGGEGRPSRSHYGAGVLFYHCQSPRAIHVHVSRAPGGGIQFDECFDSLVDKCQVEWTGADGIHFANSDRSIARDCSSLNTGDDCIAVVDYAKKRLAEGFLIENCVVGYSVARGIAVVGGRNGIVRNCEIGPTASNGLHIEQDAHYKTRFPENVQAENIRISGTGEFTPKKGNQYAVNILRAQNIRLSDVVVDGSTSVGLSLVDSKDVVVQNMRVSNTKGPAARFIRSSVDAKEISLANSASELLVADECPHLEISALRLHPSSDKSRPLRPVRLRGSQRGRLQIIGTIPKLIQNDSPGLQVLTN